MAFISILLLSIALLSVYLGNLYNRGSTMKDINQAGAEIASDIKRSIAAADKTRIRTKNIPIVGPANVDARYKRIEILCTDTVSYVVNSPYQLSVYDPATYVYASNRLVHFIKAGVWQTDPIRLAKIQNPGLCGANTVPQLKALIAGTSPEQQREMLAQESSHNLSVWSFASSAYPSLADAQLVTVSLSIGTKDHSDLNIDVGLYPPNCKTDIDTAWCGVNTFEIVARSSKIE